MVIIVHLCWLAASTIRVEISLKKCKLFVLITLTYLLNLLTYLLTYSMEQSPWKANWFAASQEIPRVLWNSKVPHRTHKRPPPALSWASPIQSSHLHPTSWRPILTLSSHLRLGLPSGLFPSGFPTRTLYTSLPSPIRTTCPAHPNILDFITRTILSKKYRSFSSSLCNFLHSPVTSSLLGPNILLSFLLRY
jgi:hypothetical protein